MIGTEQDAVHVYLIFTGTLRERYIYSHFTDEENETQIDYMPTSHNHRASITTSLKTSSFYPSKNGIGSG